MSKKPIFLLPLDLKGIKQTRITPKFIREVYNTDKKDILPEHIQKKKNNIFTVELNRLIGKISDKNKSQTNKVLNSEIQNLEEKKSTQIQDTQLLNTQTLNPLPKQFNSEFEHLNQIYQDQNSLKNAEDYLEILFSSLGVKAYSIFFYEPHSFTYFPIITNGISDKAKTNLLFQSHDKFIQNKNEGLIHLYFQPVLLNDVFFKKKLSPVEFSKFGSILLKFFDKHKLPGLITLFFEQDKSPNQEEIEKLSSEIDIKIKPLIPFLNSLFQKELVSRTDFYDILKRNLQAIKIQSQKLGLETYYFTKLKITNFTEIKNASEHKKSLTILLKNHLLENEGLIEISHNELLLLTKENEVEKVLKYISENLKTEFQFQLSVHKYPDHGKNLYLYL